MDKIKIDSTPRILARARLIRIEKFGPRKRYERYYPKYPNKILIWLSKNKAEYALTGDQMDPSLKMSLAAVGIKTTTYKRILMNETILTLDELHDIANIIKAKPTDLI